EEPPPTPRPHPDPRGLREFNGWHWDCWLLVVRRVAVAESAKPRLGHKRMRWPRLVTELYDGWLGLREAKSWLGHQADTLAAPRHGAVRARDHQTVASLRSATATRCRRPSARPHS